MKPQQLRKGEKIRNGAILSYRTKRKNPTRAASSADDRATNYAPAVQCTVSGARSISKDPSPIPLFPKLPSFSSPLDARVSFRQTVFTVASPRRIPSRETDYVEVSLPPKLKMLLHPLCIPIPKIRAGKPQLDCN